MQRKVLLVDDEEPVRVSLSWVMENNGFAVDCAANGRDALASLERQRYDLVITDMVMEPVDGTGVLKRSKELYPDAGVIILTGHADVDSAVMLLQMGADDYLQKPCNMDDLINKARRNFEKQDLVLCLQQQNVRLQTEVATRTRVEHELEQSRAELERLVGERTAELQTTVARLQGVLDELLGREKELQEKNSELRDMNATLNTMLKRRALEHAEIRKEIALALSANVLPLLRKVKNRTAGTNRGLLETAQANLLQVVGGKTGEGVLAAAKLAPREIQVVHYIRQNKTSKEIAEFLGLSVRTIEYYRENIRKKMQIDDRRISLRKFLLSLP